MMKNAEEEYKSAIRQVGKKEQELSESERKLQENESDRLKCRTWINNRENEKINFEERLVKMRELLAYLDGKVEQKIERVNERAKAANQGYAESISCNAINGIDLTVRFYTLSVQEDENSGAARQELIRQIEVLDDQIKSLNTELNRLDDEMMKLKRRGSALEDDCHSCQIQLNQSKNDVNYWKRKL